MRNKPPNNRLKLTAHVKNYLSARSLTLALAGFSYSSLAIASDMENA
jgi:hypothetical protein